jgi:hypothetical protein
MDFTFWTWMKNGMRLRVFGRSAKDTSYWDYVSDETGAGVGAISDSTLRDMRAKGELKEPFTAGKLKKG